MLVTCTVYSVVLYMEEVMGCYEELVICKGCGAAHVEGNEILCEKCLRPEIQNVGLLKKSQKLVAKLFSKIDILSIFLITALVIGIATFLIVCYSG